jgi:hypothetical protein
LNLKAPTLLYDDVDNDDDRKMPASNKNNNNNNQEPPLSVRAEMPSRRPVTARRRAKKARTSRKAKAEGVGRDVAAVQLRKRCRSIIEEIGTANTLRQARKLERRIGVTSKVDLRGPPIRIGTSLGLATSLCRKLGTSTRWTKPGTSDRCGHCRKSVHHTGQGYHATVDCVPEHLKTSILEDIKKDIKNMFES